MKQVSSWALVLLFWLHQAYAERRTKTPGYTIPIVDLANETHRQVLVDRVADLARDRIDLGRGRRHIQVVNHRGLRRLARHHPRLQVFAVRAHLG